MNPPEKEVLTVCCVKWGAKYSGDYVEKLASMVKRHLPVEHRFLCLTDDPSGLSAGIETAPLIASDLCGSWHKLSLFSPEFHGMCPGTVLFLDLDVVIMGSLLPLIDYAPSRFCIARDFLRPRREWNSRRDAL